MNTTHTYRGITYRHLTGEDNGFGRPYDVWELTGSGTIAKYATETEVHAVIDERQDRLEAEAAEYAAYLATQSPSTLTSTVYHGDGRYTDYYSDGTANAREEY